MTVSITHALNMYFAQLSDIVNSPFNKIAKIDIFPLVGLCAI